MGVVGDEFGDLMGAAMLDQRKLKPGTRVRVADHPVQMTLRKFTGVVVRPDVHDGYYVIRLDEPGVYHHADGCDERFREIVENVDNLDLAESHA